MKAQRLYSSHLPFSHKQSSEKLWLAATVVMEFSLKQIKHSCFLVKFIALSMKRNCLEGQFYTYKRISHTSSLLRVALREEFSGNMSSSSLFPPTKKNNQKITFLILQDENKHIKPFIFYLQYFMTAIFTGPWQVTT